MCGILALFGNNESADFNEKRDHFLQLSKLIRRRGLWIGTVFILMPNSRY